MWSFDLTKRIALLGLLGLAACGFEPLHKSASGDLFGKMSIQAPTNALEFDFAQAIRNRMGQSGTPDWHLTYRLETELVRMGITDANRGRIVARLNYQLSGLSGAAEDLTGSIDAFAGFTVAETTPTDTAPIVSNRIARRDAERRLATILADRLLAELRLRLPGGTP